MLRGARTLVASTRVHAAACQVSARSAVMMPSCRTVGVLPLGAAAPSVPWRKRQQRPKRKLRDSAPEQRDAASGSPASPLCRQGVAPATARQGVTIFARGTATRSFATMSIAERVALHHGKPDQTMQKMIDAGHFQHLLPYITCASKIEGQQPPTPAEMKAVMTIFSMIDEDENGVIDQSEMHSLAVYLSKAGYGSVPEMEVTLREMDIDQNGEISLEEFALWWKHQKVSRKKSHLYEGIKNEIEYSGDGKACDRMD